MNTKQLRLKILDLAIRGKLVPQDPNDEPASVLLERIRAEKERLIKEKKIKRDKRDSSVPSSGTSHYQNVPQSWSFCRLSDIALFGGGKTPSTENKDFWDKGSHLWVTSKDMKYSVIDDSLVKISDIGVRDMQVYPPLTILMVVRSGILRRTLPIAILKNEATINQDIKAICLYDNSIANYIFWVLKASEQSILEIYQKDGTTVESINFERFKDVVIPIPPYSEQRRIVSAIETAFSLIDEIEENKTSIEQLIKQTKSKVLDLSVRGKLVRQHNDEEPVSSLLSKINGRQKSPKPSADIFHYPFKVPNSWIWAKGSECFNPMENKRPTGDIFGYIDINSIDNKKHTIAKLKYLKASEAPSRASRRVNAGDILFSLVRPYLENIAYVDKQFVDCIASTGFYVCKPRPLLFPKYLYHLMLSPYVINGLNTFMKGDNSPSINNDNITSFLYPLPPLQEQLRIVDQIEKILAQLDKIEEAIKA